MEIVLISFLGAICLIIGIGYGLIADRGFDISDEGISYLHMANPKEVTCYPFFDYVFTHTIFRLAGKNIAFMRVLLLLFNAAGAGCFAYGFNEFLAQQGLASGTASCLTISLLFFITASLRLCFGSVIPNYNQMNGTLILFCAGLTLQLASSPQPSSGHTLLLAGLVGGVICAQLFIKISSGLVNLVITTCFLGLQFRNTPVVALSHMGIVACGVIAFACIYFTVLQPYSTWWRIFSTQLRFARLFSWGLGSIKRHLHEVRDLLKRIIQTYSTTFILIAAVAYFASRSQPISPVLATALIALLLLDTIKISSDNKFYRGNAGAYPPTANITLFHLTLALATIVGATILDGLGAEHASRLSPEMLIVTGYLLVLPFAGAAGTGNPIYINTVFQIPPWTAVTILHLTLSEPITDTRILTLVLIGCLGVFSLLQIYFAYVKFPYRLVTPVTQQIHPTKIGEPPTSLKIDQSCSIFFNKLRALMNISGFVPGSDILGLFDIPGVVYAVGGTSPGHQWFFRSGFDAKMMEANYHHLRGVASERLQQAFILQHGPIEDFSPYFAQLQLNFPEGYLNCGFVTSPYSGLPVIVWKPRGKLTLQELLAAKLLQQVSDASQDQQLAKTLLSYGCERFPDSLEIKRRLSQVLVKEGDRDAAQGVLDEILERFPYDDKALVERGCLHLKSDDRALAKDDFTAALRSEQLNDDAYFFLAGMATDERQEDLAIQMLGLAFRINPNNLNRWIENAKAAIEQQRFDQARQILGIAKRIDPTCSQVNNYLFALDQHEKNRSRNSEN